MDRVAATRRGFGAAASVRFVVTAGMLLGAAGGAAAQTPVERSLPLHEASRDLRWRAGATGFRLGVLTRGRRGDRYWTATAAVERTVHEGRSAGRLGVLLEVRADGRSAAAPPSSPAGDVFAGARWTLAGPTRTAVLAGTLVDRARGATIVLVEVERRLRSAWTAVLTLQPVDGTSHHGPARGRRRDGVLSLRLRRRF